MPLREWAARFDLKAPEGIRKMRLIPLFIALLVCVVPVAQAEDANILSLSMGAFSRYGDAEGRAGQPTAHAAADAEG